MPLEQEIGQPVVFVLTTLEVSHSLCDDTLNQTVPTELGQVYLPTSFWFESTESGYKVPSIWDREKCVKSYISSELVSIPWCRVCVQLGKWLGGLNVHSTCCSGVCCALTACCVVNEVDVYILLLPCISY